MGYTAFQSPYMSMWVKGVGFGVEHLTHVRVREVYDLGRHCLDLVRALLPTLGLVPELLRVVVVYFGQPELALIPTPKRVHEVVDHHH